MKTNMRIKIVGNYMHPQGKPSDCKICHNADFGDVIIDDICGKCLHHHRDSTMGLWAIDKVIDDGFHFEIT